MKASNIEKSIKSSTRKHYVRKKEFDALKNQVKQLSKKLAKLEKSSLRVKTKESKKSATAKAERILASDVAQAAGPNQDKLTRIKGIGPVLESKLQKLGIRQFSQIAKWTEQDIDTVSEHLNFKGRIEREEWIKQARGLV